MSIDVKQFRDLIIRPVLQDMGLYNGAAEKLLLMIAAHESHFKYFRQVVGKGYGPAYGFYQMEVGTLRDLWINYLGYRKHWASHLKSYASPIYECDDPRQLYCPLYATAAARLQLLRFPKFPPEDDLSSLSNYLKKYWNTEIGKASPDDYKNAYIKYVESVLNEKRN